MRHRRSCGSAFLQRSTYWLFLDDSLELQRQISRTGGSSSRVMMQPGEIRDAQTHSHFAALFADGRAVDTLTFANETANLTEFANRSHELSLRLP